jgi:hypothetical protein
MDACMHACKSRQRVEYSRIMISYNLHINNPRQENGFLNRCWPVSVHIHVHVVRSYKHVYTRERTSCRNSGPLALNLNVRRSVKQR